MTLEDGDEVTQTQAQKQSATQSGIYKCRLCPKSFKKDGKSIRKRGLGCTKNPANN